MKAKLVRLKENKSIKAGKMALKKEWDCFGSYKTIAAFSDCIYNYFLLFLSVFPCKLRLRPCWGFGNSVNSNVQTPPIQQETIRLWRQNKDFFFYYFFHSRIFFSIFFNGIRLLWLGLKLFLFVLGFMELIPGWNPRILECFGVGKDLEDDPMDTFPLSQTAPTSHKPQNSPCLILEMRGKREFTTQQICWSKRRGKWQDPGKAEDDGAEEKQELEEPRVCGLAPNVDQQETEQFGMSAGMAGQVFKAENCHWNWDLLPKFLVQSGVLAAVGSRVCPGDVQGKSEFVVESWRCQGKS